MNCAPMIKAGYGELQAEPRPVVSVGRITGWGDFAAVLTRIRAT